MAAGLSTRDYVELSARVDVVAPLEKVHDVLGDLRNDAKWREGVTVVVPSPQKVGDAVTERQPFPEGVTITTPETLTPTIYEIALQSTLTATYDAVRIRQIRIAGPGKFAVTEHCKVDPGVPDHGLPRHAARAGRHRVRETPSGGSLVSQDTH
jgi:hypothetical protein